MRNRREKSYEGDATLSLAMQEQRSDRADKNQVISCISANSHSGVVISGDETTFYHLKLQYMKLTALKNKGFKTFNLAQAKRYGVTPSLLTHYIKKGLVSRVSHGLYRFSDDAPIDFESLLREKLKAIPQGIIGFQTAIRFYGLGEELPGEIDVIVPSTNIPKRKLEDVILHAAKTEIHKVDVKRVRGVRITSLERTIVDLLRTGASTSQAVSIYNQAKTKRLQVSLTKLKKLGSLFRAKRKVDAFIGAVL